MHSCIDYLYDDSTQSVDKQHTAQPPHCMDRDINIVSFTLRTFSVSPLVSSLCADATRASKHREDMQMYNKMKQTTPSDIDLAVRQTCNRQKMLAYQTNYVST
jgi:hypothetical protein